MAIRYDRQFNQEIRRVVANFNKKVKRLEQADHAILPDRILVSDLKKEFTRRTDLKRELRRLQAFSERGAEDIVTLGNVTDTKWGFAIEKDRARVAKLNLTREIRQIESQGNLSPRNSDYLANLKYRRNYLNLPRMKLEPYQLKTREKIISQDENRIKKQQIFYDNVFNMLFKVAYQTGADQNKMINILSQLRQLSPAQLSEAIEGNAALKDFVDKYTIYTGVSKENSAANDDVLDSIDNLNQQLPSIMSYYGNL